MDAATSTTDDNPFAGPKVQAPGKVLVQMPTDDWLCKKLSKLHLTLVEIYPSSQLWGRWSHGSVHLTSEVTSQVEQAVF